jgi:hypothetical protein
LAKGDAWDSIARTIQDLLRSMRDDPRRYSLPRVIVAQCAYAMVLDPSASPRVKRKAVALVVKMLQQLVGKRHRLDGRSSRAPLAEAGGNGSLDRVPLNVLLASVSSASELAKRDGDAITKADPPERARRSPRGFTPPAPTTP